MDSGFISFDRSNMESSGVIGCCDSECPLWFLLWWSCVIAFSFRSSFTACQSLNVDKPSVKTANRLTGYKSVNISWNLFSPYVRNVSFRARFIYFHGRGSNVTVRVFTHSPAVTFLMFPVAAMFRRICLCWIFPLCSISSTEPASNHTTLFLSLLLFFFFFFFFRRLGGKIITHKDKYKSKTKPSNSNSGSSCLPWKEDKTGKKKKKTWDVYLNFFFL